MRSQYANNLIEELSLKPPSRPQLTINEQATSRPVPKPSDRLRIPRGDPGQVLDATDLHQAHGDPFAGEVETDEELNRGKLKGGAYNRKPEITFVHPQPQTRFPEARPVFNSQQRYDPGGSAWMPPPRSERQQNYGPQLQPPHPQHAPPSRIAMQRHEHWDPPPRESPPIPNPTLGTRVGAATQRVRIPNQDGGTQTVAGKAENLQTTTTWEERAGEVHLRQDHLQPTIATTQGDLRTEGRKHQSCTGHPDTGGDPLSMIAKKKYIENNRM